MSLGTTNLGKKRQRACLDGIAELRDYAANHPEITHRVHLGQCLQFVSIYVSHARDLAKDGQKDAAREWLRFLRSSHILDVLAHEKAECHPLDVPEYATDLQAIRAMLQQIFLKVSGQPEIKVLEHPKHKHERTH